MGNLSGPLLACLLLAAGFFARPSPAWSKTMAAGGKAEVLGPRLDLLTEACEEFEEEGVVVGGDEDRQGPAQKELGLDAEEGAGRKGRWSEDSKRKPRRRGRRG